MRAPVRVFRSRNPWTPGEWGMRCRVCGASGHAWTHPSALRSALAHLRATHTYWTAAC